jgi:NTP pyrophosphatase (non-canonical NTP hydrolase)
MNDQHLPFQTRVANFFKEHNLETSVEVRLLDLLAELGELAKEVLKSSEYGQIPFTETEAWEEELGDVFFSLVSLAYSSNVVLEKALDKALVKYQARIESKGDAGSEEY